MDATALAATIAGGETSCVSVMEATLQRVRERADLGAVRYVDEDLALSMAKACDMASPNPEIPLFAGVPLLMKDLGNAAAGLTPVAGSAALLRRADVTKSDSALVRCFRQAGFIPFGLSTTPEFGLALSSEPPMGPIARNPWNPALTPGGSSGGAAAAVAAGLVSIAHATDAAGSIRVPAACCGLVGLKPTRGATPNGPTFGNDLMGLVGELVLAKSVRDVRSVLTLCSGQSQGPQPDPHFVKASTEKRQRIGFVDQAAGIGAIGPAQAEAVASAADHFMQLGHTLVKLDARILLDLAQRANQIARTILSVSLAEWLASLDVGDSEISVLASATAFEGRNLPATALFAASRNAAVISHEMWQVFGNVDAAMTPMLMASPPPVGTFALDHRNVAMHFAKMADFAPYAALANVSGIPAISVPHGNEPNGLPLAVQLLGPMGSDFQLMSLASALEHRKPWSYDLAMASTKA